MHYFEELPDSTVIGLYDGSQPAGAISESQYWLYHETIAQREHPRTRGHPPFTTPKYDFPLRAIEHARVRTALISTYRIHSRKYLIGGNEFPRMWPPRDVKLNTFERFSPPETVGYYFGLTVDAALAEASYYDGTDLERHPDSTKVILVHRTYFTDLLYLAPVVGMVWEYLKLPDMPLWEMFIAIMNPRTGNEITNAIGLMARERGFKGVIFPSARYGYRASESVGAGAPDRLPLLNFVEIGSHLCEDGIAIQLTLSALIGGLTRKSQLEPPTIVYSEPNIVVFDEDIVAGRDRPVFYATYNLADADAVRKLDERLGLKHQIEFEYDEHRIKLFVDDPKFVFMLEAPRE